MQYKRHLFTAIFSFCLGLFKLQAQETIITSGGKASGKGGSVNYSLGQVVYTNITETGGTIIYWNLFYNHYRNSRFCIFTKIK